MDDSTELVTCRILAVVNIMELDMDVNSDVVDHWLWLEMLRIEWLVGEESGNTSAGLLPG